MTQEHLDTESMNTDGVQSVESRRQIRGSSLRFSLLSGVLVIFALFCVSIADRQSNAAETQQKWMEEQLGDGLNQQEKAAADLLTGRVADQISNIEWLAPLAPVALSPFFGLTLLSGLACYGPDWLPENALLSETSPLANPVLFWIFLLLTVITSLPRFSKVSKPVAQFADFLETWSAIVILIVMKIATMDFGSANAEVAVQAGMLSIGWQGLLIIAMVINIIVINSVKFFFEFLVWITPVPFLDACFELVNKTICVALMTVYAVSPMAALALNVVLFVACLLVFAWIQRREIFYRSMLIDWIVLWWKRSKSKSATVSIPDRLPVFPHEDVGSIPARARCTFERCDSGWKLTCARWLRKPVVQELSGIAEIDQGWWTNAIVFDHGYRLTFGSRYNDNLTQLASQFGVGIGDAVTPANMQTGRRVDFA